MQIATREDVLACFRLLLGREPSVEEKSGHFAAFIGAPLSSVVSGYLQAPGFRRRGLLQPGNEAELVNLDGFCIYIAKDDLLIAPGIRAGYEPEVTRVFLEHLGQGAFVDAGANCGYFALLAASRGARVYAFEPLPRNVRLLHASTELNQFRNLTIMAAAASDSPRTLTIGAAHTNGIVGAPPCGPQAALAADYVAAVRIDDVVPKDEPVSLIRMDVEGHEYRALLGATEIINTWRPFVISEFSPGALRANSGKSGEEYLQLLSTLGYTVSLIGNPGVNTVEAILGSCAGRDHVDILGIPGS